MFNDFFQKFKVDSFTTILVFTILFCGFLIFFSASLGVMARYEAKFYSIIQNQFLFGLLCGSTAFLIGAFLPIKFFKNLSIVFYLIGIISCILIFVPGLGLEHGGAKRWLLLGNFSFQPSEILKYSSVLILSAFYSVFHENTDSWKYRLLPVLILSFFVLLVLKEPDLGTATIILSGIFGVFLFLYAKFSDILILTTLTLFLFFGFYFYYPHAKDRVNTFLFPDQNTTDQNFQANQTRISIGSGGLWGVGYGKSTQKFHNLPEPVGDSIFAVIGEEFGFLGSLIVLFLILILFYRLVFLSYHHRDPFPKGVLLGTGTIILIQAFLNIGSASGAIPFTGVPLPLISHGSTSIIITLGMLGLCAKLGIRKYLH